MHLQIIQGLAVTTSISLVDSPVSTKLNCQNNFLYSQNSSCDHLLQAITPSQWPVFQDTKSFQVKSPYLDHLKIS